MKAGTESKAKFLKLQRRLGMRKYECAGLLEMLWQVTARDAPRGDIGRLSNEDIAATVDWGGDEDELIRNLVDTGWLDESDEFRLVVHDWHEHAPTYVKGIISRSEDEFVTKLSTKSATKSATKFGVSSSSEATTKPSVAKPSVAKPSDSPCSPPAGDGTMSQQDFFDRWNRFAERTPKLRACRKLTDKRRKQIRSRLCAGGWLEDFREAIKSLPLGGDGWQPDLDWLIRNDHNVYLLLEGAFDWRCRDDPAMQRLAKKRRQTAAEDRRLREEQEAKQLASAARSVIDDILPQKAGSDDETLESSLLYGEEDE